MKRIIISIITLLVIAGGIWLVLPDQQAQEVVHIAPTPTVVEPTYPTPPQVQPIVDRLGLDKNLVAKISITVPPDASSCSKSNLTTAVACHGFHSIVFPANLLGETEIEQNRSFAHEYMHEVWANMSNVDKGALMPAVNQAYQSHATELNQRLTGYNLTDQDRANELHSYICTEMADSEIPQPLLSHCVQYLPNRLALPTYY